MFLDSSLVKDASTDLMHAVTFPQKAAIDWHESATSTVGFQFYSDVCDAAHRQVLVAQDTGLSLFNTSGKRLFHALWTSNASTTSP